MTNPYLADAFVKQARTEEERDQAHRLNLEMRSLAHTIVKYGSAMRYRLHKSRITDSQDRQYIRTLRRCGFKVTIKKIKYIFDVFGTRYETILEITWKEES
jgi:hypothetical protein